jgi:hypothetical protein
MIWGSFFTVTVSQPFARQTLMHSLPKESDLLAVTVQRLSAARRAHQFSQGATRTTMA